MDWLTTEILTGFQKLLCLGLERTPAEAVIEGTAMTWREALTTGKDWDEGRDRLRFQRAFITLARTRRTWPTPADFIEALPPPDQNIVALPRPKADDAKVREIFSGLAKSLGVGNG